MPSYYHKLNNHLDKEVAVSENEQNQLENEFNQEHNYVGAEYLYLKNKLNSGQIHRNLRENGYKNEYINKYDEIYHVMFSLYWVLFVIYVGLCAYRSQFFVHTFVFIIIMIAFPFFINPLTDIVKIAMNDGLDYMNHFSISDPNIAKKGEEWVEDVQKDFYETDSGKKIAKAFESGSDYASSGTDYASGYIRKSQMTNSERDLEALLNSMGEPPDVPKIMTLDWMGDEIKGDKWRDHEKYIQQPSIKIYRAPIAKETRGEDGLLYEFKLNEKNAKKWIEQDKIGIFGNNNWNASYKTNMKIGYKNDREPIVKPKGLKEIDTDDGNLAYFELILKNHGTILKYRWEYAKGELEWTQVNIEDTLGPGLTIPVVSNGNTIYRWEKQADKSWVKKIS